MEIIKLISWNVMVGGTDIEQSLYHAYGVFLLLAVFKNPAGIHTCCLRHVMMQLQLGYLTVKPVSQLQVLAVGQHILCLMEVAECLRAVTTVGVDLSCDDITAQ